MTHGLLADIVGARRVVISRTISAFAQQRLVTIESGVVAVADADALRRLSAHLHPDLWGANPACGSAGHNVDSSSESTHALSA